jgi:hypothetical protein
MAKPFFDPPYDSPIEEDFAHNILKYLDDLTSFEKQVPVETTHGTFFLDFVIRLFSGLSIGIECDGKEFHDRYRDEWRDAIILSNSNIEEIVRLTGEDIYYHINDLIYVLSRWYPKAFSERGHILLKALASEDAKSIKNYNTVSVYLSLANEDDERIYTSRIKRRTKANYDTKGQFWKNLAKYAINYPSAKIDELIEYYDLDHPI